MWCLEKQRKKGGLADSGEMKPDRAAELAKKKRKVSSTRRATSALTAKKIRSEKTAEPRFLARQKLHHRKKIGKSQVGKKKKKRV